MNAIWLLLAGVVAGVLGGMGLGGGVLLIPLLTFLLGIPYGLTVWINLVVFLPTAVVSLVLHTKNRLIEPRSATFLFSFAVLGSLVGTLLLGKVSESLLQRAFGVFLLAIGTLSIFPVLIGFFKKKAK